MNLVEDEGWGELKTRFERILSRVCPSWPSADRDDLVQGALIRIIAKVRNEGNPDLRSSYLWKVAHSVFVDEIRRRKRRQEVSLEVSEVGREMGRTENPEVQSESREIARAVRRCLGSLISSRKRAVTLHLLGHSVPDAARRLDWSPKKTENLTYRGLSDLRKCLQKRRDGSQ